MSLKEFGTAPKPINNRIRIPISSDISESSGEKRKDTGDVCQWVLGANGNFMAAPATAPTLPPGAYSVAHASDGIHIIRKDISVDSLLDFPDSKQDKIMQEIQTFWDNVEPFRRYGFLHRRGYLMYGPPGGGKSCLIQQIIKRVIGSGDVVFVMDCPPGLFRVGLQLFRSVEPDRRVVCVFEDVDSIIDRYGDDELLNLLDGDNQIDHALNLGTTNYPERLDPRIVGRPRRFDSIIKIGMPSKAMREAFFKKKLNLDQEDIPKWVKASAKLSFAALSELVISVKCLGNDFDATVKKLREMADAKPNSKDDTATNRVGFLSADTEFDD